MVSVHEEKEVLTERPGTESQCGVKLNVLGREPQVQHLWRMQFGVDRLQWRPVSQPQATGI